MSERPKLKPKRFNKFEISGSRTPSKTISTSSDIPRRPHKRICNEVKVSSNNKKMCYGLMHPPSSTVNLANNRLRKLKQTLQTDLKNRKECEPTLLSTTRTITKPSSNDSLNISNELHPPGECGKGIYKNLNKWASPTSDSTGNSANQRLKKLKKVITETTTHTGTPKFNDSSGPSQKPTLEISPRGSSRPFQNSTILTSRPISSPHTPRLSTPEDNHCSPLIRDKINCKRKLSDSSPNVEEHTSSKQFVPDNYPHTQSVSKVKTSTVDKTKTTPPLENCLSGRILKIKNKTEEINNSLNNRCISPESENFNRSANDIRRSSLDVHSPNLGSRGFNKLGETCKASSTPISQRLKIQKQHPYTNDNSNDRNSSDFKRLSTSANSRTQDSSLRYGNFSKSDLTNDYVQSTSQIKSDNSKNQSPAPVSSRSPLFVDISKSKLPGSVNSSRPLFANSPNLSSRLETENYTSKSSISQRLKVNRYSDSNRSPNVASHSANTPTQKSTDYNKPDLTNYSKITPGHSSAQIRLNRFKEISEGKSKSNITPDPNYSNEEIVSSTTVKLSQITPSRDNLNHTNQLANNYGLKDSDKATVSTSFTLTQIKPTGDDINSVVKSKYQNPCALKVPADILTQESISAFNAPLPADCDNFGEKMAMTASWIKNHQRFGDNCGTVAIPNAENTAKDVIVANNVDAVDDSEEMEWSNAEPITDVQDVKKITEDQKVTNKSEETQTPVDSKTDAKDKRLCIVVDTNVFISDLSKMNDIINLKVTGPIQPLIYIPWMVVTELDEMKDRSGSSSLKQKVMNAIKCINKLLSEENPRVKGQTVCDMGKQIHVGGSQDDKIIGTCLQATEKYESVILLSSDVNLKNKGMINGITAASPQEIIMKIMSKLVKNTKYQKIMQKMSMLCSSIICECSKEAYGDAWSRMDMLSNPPWSLLECTKRFQKYWIAVFQEKLMKQFKTAVDKLNQLLTDNNYFCDDSSKYNEFVKLSLNLCIFLKDIEEYRGSIETTMNDITKIG